MVVKIVRTEQNFQFKAWNDSASFPIVAKPELSDNADGFRPMELLLVGLGGCMSIDVLNILYKQKQEIKAYEVSISGERHDDTLAAFKSITIDLIFKGQVDEIKAQKAIALTEEKYCSVYHSLNPSIEITSKFQILPSDAS